MKAMIQITKELLPHLPAGHTVGGEIEVEYDVRWEGYGVHSFQSDEGDAIVECVIYDHTGEEIDLTDLVEIEIDEQECENARQDAYEAHADYVYDCWKERDL